MRSLTAANQTSSACIVLTHCDCARVVCRNIHTYTATGTMGTSFSRTGH